LIQLPSRIQRFPPEGDWKAIKDEIRRLRNDEFVQSIRKEEDRIGRDIPQVGEEMEAIDNSIGLDSIPRVLVQQGSAWLEFRSYNDATRLYGNYS